MIRLTLDRIRVRDLLARPRPASDVRLRDAVVRDLPGRRRPPASSSASSMPSVDVVGVRPAGASPAIAGAPVAGRLARLVRPTALTDRGPAPSPRVRLAVAALGRPRTRLRDGGTQPTTRARWPAALWRDAEAERHFRDFAGRIPIAFRPPLDEANAEGDVVRSPAGCVPGSTRNRQRPATGVRPRRRCAR